MRQVLIYALVDPRTKRERYIGRTVNPLRRRLREHIATAARGKLKDRRKADWFDELAALGLAPDIVEIDRVGLDSFQAAERRWVAHFRAIHPDLLNVKRGGDGGLGGHFVVWTPELDAMLGKVTDSALAKRIGVTRKAVSYRREQLGIPASFDRSENKPPPPMGGHNKLDLPAAVIARMGKEPDYRIADDLGIQKSIIARRRRSLGIPSYAESTGNRGVFTKGMPHPRWSKRIGTDVTSAAN